MLGAQATAEKDATRLRTDLAVMIRSGDKAQQPLRLPQEKTPLIYGGNGRIFGL